MRLGSLFLLLLCCARPSYGEELSICYNYGCASRATVYMRGAELSQIRMLFSWVESAEDERKAIAQAIGQFIAFSGRQSPTFRDHGGNLADEGEDGRMDCIDHAHNATLYLKLMEEHGWLKFHKILEPVSRPYQIISSHWAARIAEHENGLEFVPEYVLDSWFFNPGHPAAIFTLIEWKSGAEPHD